MRNYGYNDPELVQPATPWTVWKWLSLLLAIVFIIGVWLALDAKLLFGSTWLSETYDNEDWRTNEGNLHTYGAWDLEAHIWKTQYIVENFPHFQWNPYWYLGMPLIKYYQAGFYALHWFVTAVTGLHAARTALLLVVFGHLLATFMTFLLCYKVSRRIWVSALCSVFLLSNTFISLRSYGWEPITVIFLFLYPLGLLIFLKDPLRPFRLSLILVVAISYLCHPLLWFSLCMTMGLYLLSVALTVNPRNDPEAATKHYIWAYIAMVVCAIFVSAVQFVPQITYEQVTSGAHMGVKYLPFYQVPPNIITLKDFFFDAGNLKGPGPVIMIAFLLLIGFSIMEYRSRKKHVKEQRMVLDNELVRGLTLALFMMVLFYYLERYNVFPMNFLRSIQYHRIIPEFIVTAAAIVAALSNLAHTYRHKLVYYSMLVSFVLASGLVIYNVQDYWQTTDSIAHKPEFVYDDIPGRFTVPYTDQSFAVRNSFTLKPQVYGYYEQGITNPYDDEMFSVSSGFHNAETTILYLKAANVGRLYVNMEEGERDRIVTARLNGTLPYVVNNSRYAYFEIPLENPSFAEAVDGTQAWKVQQLEPPCRIIFKEKYCGSNKEEFVSTDPTEQTYLQAYVDLLEARYAPKAALTTENPDSYRIEVSNATTSTAVVVKMTYDKDFVATVNGQKVPVEIMGPHFMLIRPDMEGNYTIHLKYRTSREIIVGAIISAVSLILLLTFFAVRSLQPRRVPKALRFTRGDL